MKKKLLSGCGCLLVMIAVFFAFAGVSMIFVNRGILPEIEKNMVILDKPVVLPENEGKLVLVRGKAASEQEYVVDPIFGVTAKSPKLYRNVLFCNCYRYF